MKKIVLSIAVTLTVMLASVYSASAQEAVQPATTVQSNPAASTTPAAPEKHPMSVNNRLKRQQARINQGIQNGSLTRGEAKNLEHHEANIATDAKIDRAENGGKLTPQEHKNLERRLNKQSGRIFRKKHNARTQG
jgi:hypothetical protein